jgi:hypothetical protein
MITSKGYHKNLVTEFEVSRNFGKKECTAAIIDELDETVFIDLYQVPFSLIFIHLQTNNHHIHHLKIQNHTFPNRLRMDSDTAVRMSCFPSVTWTWKDLQTKQSQGLRLHFLHYHWKKERKRMLYISRFTFHKTQHKHNTKHNTQNTIHNT